MAYVAGPFDSAHLYLQWGGKLPGNESWSNGLRLRKVGGGVTMSGDPASMLAGVTTALSAFHQRTTTKTNSMAKLSFVKLNAITTAGTYMTDSTYEQVLADLAGAVASPIYPNQVALAVSLETGFSRGPAHAGRVYLPMPAIDMQANGNISTGDAGPVGVSFDTLLSDLNAVDAAYEVAVFSRKLGAATNRKVTGVRVGTILDTQRRRRRSLIENYQ